MIAVYYQEDGSIFMVGQGAEQQIRADGLPFVIVADPSLDYCNDFRVVDGAVVPKDANA